ncbi:MAG: 2-dehydropantoate 2-reductase [Zetaproteobacteria bacterium]|nr:MAG: 2-dehydropantoate 2-reductase [Zetaproteobacteria bacterium]
MRIGIAGAGAVGCHYAAALIGSGADVFLLARGEHLQALRNRGLVWESNGQCRTLSVQSDDDASILRSCQIIVLACKVTQLRTMLDQLATSVGEQALFLTLQNGVVAPEWVAARFPDAPVVAGTAFIGARLIGPGRILHTAAGGIRMAAWNTLASKDERVVRLKDMLRKAGVPVRIEQDALSMLWRKLLWNCGFNAITALTRRFAKDIAARTETAQVAMDAMHEALAIARALGVRGLGDEDVRKHMEVTLAMGPVKTSMWQDLERGRPTEIDYINGQIVRDAQAIGQDVPVNRMLVALMHAVEGGV